MGERELKPCPCCSGEATLETTPELWGYTEERVWVECSRCGIQTKPAKTTQWKEGIGTVSVKEEAEALVRALWNKRVTPTPAPTEKDHAER